VGFDRNLGLRDVLVPELGDGLLALDALAAGIRDPDADRVLDADTLGHQVEPALLVILLDAAPEGAGGQ
jgi:hypothetical protein